jgi:putative cell wall-binding protein
MTSHTSTTGELPGATRGRLLALLGVFALMFTLVAPFAPQATASHGDGDPDDIATERLAGENRHETACDIALDTFPDGSETVIITRADDFPDTLAGNYLAGQLDVPILLTPNPVEDPDAVDSHTAFCLDELETENVVILGGPDAVPE